MENPPRRFSFRIQFILDFAGASIGEDVCKLQSGVEQIGAATGVSDIRS